MTGTLIDDIHRQKTIARVLLENVVDNLEETWRLLQDEPLNRPVLQLHLDDALSLMVIALEELQKPEYAPHGGA